MADHHEAWPFETWVAYIFDQEVHKKISDHEERKQLLDEIAYLLDDEELADDEEMIPFSTIPPQTNLANLIKLFEEPLPILGRYTDGQINRGFWEMIGEGGEFCFMIMLTDESLPLPMRLRCLQSFKPLFRKLFAARCTPHLSHLDQPGANPLNSVCYMWWDIITFYGNPNNLSRREVDAAALEVMESILKLDSLPCQESALHGLGHWQHDYPGRVRQIIDAAIPTLPAVIGEYAQSARRGSVL